MPFINPIFWNSYFEILVEPHYEGNDDQFAKHCQTPRNVLLLIIRATFWSYYFSVHAEPHSDPKYDQFAKHSHKPFIHRFPLVCLCVSCKQHFGVLAVKFLLNQITTHNMASLENYVTRVRIIVLCYSFSAYH